MTYAKDALIDNLLDKITNAILAYLTKVLKHKWRNSTAKCNFGVSQYPLVTFLA